MLSDDELRMILDIHGAAQYKTYHNRPRARSLLAPALTCQRLLGVVRAMGDLHGVLFGRSSTHATLRRL